MGENKNNQEDVTVLDDGSFLQMMLDIESKSLQELKEEGYDVNEKDR